MSITVSNHTLDQLHTTEQELLIDFACYLYDKGRMTFGKCAILCGLNQYEFQQALSTREIDIKYTMDDLEVDLQNMGISL